MLVQRYFLFLIHFLIHSKTHTALFIGVNSSRSQHPLAHLLTRRKQGSETSNPVAQMQMSQLCIASLIFIMTLNLATPSCTKGMGFSKKR